MADYYELLGVPRTASVEEIRAAYRRRASESHPDRHPGDVQVAKKFCEFSQAYEILMDSAQRRAYDRSGTTKPENLFDSLAADLESALSIFGQVASFFEVPEPKKRSECTTCGGTGESSIEIGPLSFRSSCPDCEAEKPSPVSGDRP
jgi:DnaJ-class molecular chaperone